MEPTVITFLPIEDMRVLKQIILVNDSKYGRDVSIGYILYEREFSSNYKFKETPKEEKDFKYHLEYPRQDSYPNDKVDDLILQSIKNTFPKSRLRNHSIVCNIDQQKLMALQNRTVEKSDVQITPDFSGIDIYSLAGKQFKTVRKVFSIYSESQIDDITNLAFFGYYDISDNKILDGVLKVKFK
ncbi:MAG: hypothetical protein HY015_03565 [Bacteroidetes bacterium]|nr:hypothetical protein [Bacteroidota bacterium]MBI3482041.1 hypothetical protein [Bacteroidota bacterium]